MLRKYPSAYHYQWLTSIYISYFETSLIARLCFYILLRILYEFEEGAQQGNNRTAEPTLDITCATFELILDFIYTGKVVIDNDNIEEILKASDLLLMTDLKVGFMLVTFFIHEKCLGCSCICMVYVQ